MSETVDANIVVYASLRSSPFHDAAREFMTRFCAGPQLRYLFWPTVMAYLRIVTSRRVTDRPLEPAAALANVDTLVSQPHIVTAGARSGFLQVYRSVADVVEPRGNLVPDAHIVALMRQHGVGTIWTHDRDFRKFDGIRVRDPFA